MIHIRQPYVPTSQQAPELPREVVWLRRATLALLALLALMALTVALRQVMRLPMFAINTMTVRGESSYDVQFHNAHTLRANVLPTLTGHFFNIDLRALQARFEALPWVHTATVRRVFPNSLAVTLTAHTPVARWVALTALPTLPQTLAEDSLGNESSGERRDDTNLETLLTPQGDIFEASGGQLDTDHLPLLSGPNPAATQVLGLYQQLSARLQTTPEHAKLTSLTLTQQGLWRGRLASGAALELGAGSAAQVMERVERWLGAAPSLSPTYSAHALQSLDLRYPNGFAMRLAGVTTKQGN